MKNKTIISLGLALFLAFACTPMDEYLKIAGEKEIIYPGKIEDVEVKTGKNRLLVEGHCYSDAKITACRIYWALGSEYVEVPVDMSSGPFTVSREIELPEDTYNFDIYTYDADGNRSIPVNVSSQTYGDKYIASLTSRIVKSFTFDGSKGVMTWFNIDVTAGAYKTEVTYRTSHGEDRTVEISVKDTTLELPDYDGSTPVSYTTVYKPDETCLDDFRTEARTASAD